MNHSDRERELADTFVLLADTLVSDYHVADLLHTLVDRCASLLDAQDAGILIADGTGQLVVVASTSGRGQSAAESQLSAGEGPCIDAYTTGALVTVDSIADSYARWPDFAERATDSGYQSTHAIPMRLREHVIGSLTLYRDSVGPLNDQDAATGRALADAATIGILQERALRQAGVVEGQLKSALESRVVIEQAKGVLARDRNVTPDDAFKLLRKSARDSGRPLTDVARDVLGKLAPPEV